LSEWQLDVLYVFSSLDQPRHYRAPSAWKLVDPLLQGKPRTVRPRKTELGQMIDLLRY
jgi:hypothetical protein